MLLQCSSKTSRILEPQNQLSIVYWCRLEARTTIERLGIFVDGVCQQRPNARVISNGNRSANSVLQQVETKTLPLVGRVLATEVGCVSPPGAPGCSFSAVFSRSLPESRVAGFALLPVITEQGNYLKAVVGGTDLSTGTRLGQIFDSLASAFVRAQVTC